MSNVWFKIPATLENGFRSALAEAELEYNAAHRSKAVTVRLKLDKVPDTVSPGDAPVYALVWTTTPWTLPVNQAVCFNPELTYSLVSVGEDLYIVAAELVESLQQKLGREIQTVNSFPGKQKIQRWTFFFGL